MEYYKNFYIKKKIIIFLFLQEVKLDEVVIGDRIFKIVGIVEYFCFKGFICFLFFIINIVFGILCEY